MPAKGQFKYNPGDKIGPYNLILLERTKKDSDGRHWMGKFECQFCKEHKIFEANLTKVARGEIRSCGCQKGCHEYTYNIGDKIGPHGAILLERLDRIKNVQYGIFKCPKCGEPFKASFSNIISGSTIGCTCSRSEDLTGRRFGKILVLNKNENKTYGNGTFIWNCICDCGNICEINTTKLNTYGEDCSCGCESGSIGEQRLARLLSELKIFFIKQKSFNNCRNPKTNKKLFFDFYLPDYNCCIEYDGQQHFEESSLCQDTLEERQYRDNIKNQYCKNNNIKLIRIPYTDFKILNIEYLKELL